ncbi:MAG TPA: DUF4926 domain-containing protein [Tepidisphaeraceae bacterium]|jgi:hypothetical protein|nr:DUF4926 domain-containing protein [Tepidisphaeraceae bacterium]
MIKEHDRVVLKTDVPSERLQAGDVGTVDHVCQDGKAFEVEFVTLDGRTAAVVTLEAAQVRPVTSQDITHAPQLARA